MAVQAKEAWGGVIFALNAGLSHITKFDNNCPAGNFTNIL
jgi:hypothetical protein